MTIDNKPVWCSECDGVVLSEIGKEHELCINCLEDKTET